MEIQIQSYQTSQDGPGSAVLRSPDDFDALPSLRATLVKNLDFGVTYV